MIVAVGIDLVEIDRIRGLVARHPQRFLERHFHAVELEQMRGRRDPVPGLAARFAAKEAFQKCWPESFGWRDVWVDKRGRRPELRTAPRLTEQMHREGWRAHLSLSHSRAHATAMVVLASRD